MSLPADLTTINYIAYVPLDWPNIIELHILLVRALFYFLRWLKFESHIYVSQIYLGKAFERDKIPLAVFVFNYFLKNVVALVVEYIFVRVLCICISAHFCKYFALPRDTVTDACNRINTFVFPNHPSTPAPRHCLASRSLNRLNMVLEQSDSKCISKNGARFWNPRLYRHEWHVLAWLSNCVIIESYSVQNKWYLRVTKNGDPKMCSKCYWTYFGHNIPSKLCWACWWS